MSYFLVNILMSLLWASLQQFRPVDVLGGFILSYLLIALTSSWLGLSARKYVRWMPLVLRFLLYYLRELLEANMLVSRMLFRDQNSLKPGIIAIPLDVKTDLEIILLNNLIAFTPGTLGVELSEDRTILFVHIIDISNAEAARQSLKFGLEKRLLEVLR